MFNEVFERHREWLKEDRLLLVEGKVSKDDYSGGLRVMVDKLFDLDSCAYPLRQITDARHERAIERSRLLDLLQPYRRGRAVVRYGSDITMGRLPANSYWVKLGGSHLHDGLLTGLNAWLAQTMCGRVLSGFGFQIN